MVANPAAERFQLILPTEAPYPHKCSVCGSVERNLVDWRLEVEYYGAVLICVECLGAASKTIGWVSPEKYAESETRASSYSRNIQAAVARAQQLVSAVSGLADDFTVDVDAILCSSSGSNDVDSDAVAKRDGEEPESDVSTDGQNDGAPVGKGSDGVPSNSSNEFEFSFD